jgi:hypothetical protein
MFGAGILLAVIGFVGWLMYEQEKRIAAAKRPDGEETEQ